MFHEVNLSIPLALAIETCLGIPLCFYSVTYLEKVILILSMRSTCSQIPNLLKEEEMMALVNEMKPLLIIKVAYCLHQSAISGYCKLIIHSSLAA